MDDTSFLAKTVDWLGGAAMAYAGWLNMKLNGIEKDITEHRVKVAENYITKSEHSEQIEKIDAKLDRILDKLDEKADKN